jgi:hypothetical protein
MGSNAGDDTKETQKNRLRVTAFVVSLLMYLIFVGVNFDPAVAKAQVGVAGERPFGIPVQVFFAGLNAILLFPIFWWTSSLMKLQAYAGQQDRSFAWVLLSAMYTLVDLFSLFTSVRDTPPRRNQKSPQHYLLGLSVLRRLGGGVDRLGGPRRRLATRRHQGPSNCVSLRPGWRYARGRRAAWLRQAPRSRRGRAAPRFAAGCCASTASF